MKLSDIEHHILSLFDSDKLDRFSEEWRFTVTGREEVSRVGYATNLTPETVKQAIREEVDLMITHHDAWPFLFGMKERCTQMLQHREISHCFFHLLLDDADFGTSATLAERLKLRSIEKSNLYMDAFYCGRIGEYERGVDFAEFRSRFERVLGEPVRAWMNNTQPVKRVCVVAGGGGMTGDIKEAVDKGCDAYVTGEKSLYTVEYAAFSGINLFVGSHTFTELPGVESFADKLGERFPDVEIVRLKEERFE